MRRVDDDYTDIDRNPSAMSHPNVTYNTPLPSSYLDTHTNSNERGLDGSSYVYGYPKRSHHKMMQGHHYYDGRPGGGSYTDSYYLDPYIYSDSYVHTKPCLGPSDFSCKKPIIYSYPYEDSMQPSIVVKSKNTSSNNTSTSKSTSNHYTNYKYINHIGIFLIVLFIATLLYLIFKK